MTDTLFEPSLTTYTSPLPELYVIPVGLEPTVMVAETVFVVSAMTDKLLEPSFDTNISAFPES